MKIFGAFTVGYIIGVLTTIWFHDTWAKFRKDKEEMSDEPIGKI